MATGFVFGQDAPCRGCHGAGQRVAAMTDEEQRAHNRENARLRRRGEPTERVLPTKPCSECDGKGYVPIAQADARRA